MAKTPLTYAAAGVDLAAADRVVELIEHDARRTYGPRVLGALGGFAGCFRLDYNEKLFKRNYKDPVLVSCTDGVGTKVKLASQLQVYDTVGQDLVAMSINDMIVQGAEPLFFLDYIAVNKKIPEMCAAMVRGVADGCVLSDCALLGGETAEMPDVYAPGDFDMAGFAVGVVELSRMITPARVEPGDVILGLASSGIHSNGYSLVRAVVKEAKLDLGKVYPELDADGKGRTLGQVLLTPTRIYARSIISVLRHYKVKQVISAMANITGSGIPGNVPRTLGDKFTARIERSSWEVPPVFKFLQKHGDIAESEMLDVFNMGVGYVVVVKPAFAESIKDQLTRLGEEVWTLGKIVKGNGTVQFV
ncbi:MAG: phosphoribosylformylglycinamidine cyclo-ligase [Planctomycetota bacterium]|nr:phosphoribosylformylglycinamidine cyclo-ligase [Planctomycetota bacterium]